MTTDTPTGTPAAAAPEGNAQATDHNAPVTATLALPPGYAGAVRVDDVLAAWALLAEAYGQPLPPDDDQAGPAAAAADGRSR